jgi:hypothetical protein
MLGTIKDRVGTGHQYLIEWYDKSENEQKEEHLFGAFTRRDKHTKDSYVLAIDENDNIYKPAKTKAISDDQKRLTVQFIDLNQNEEDASPRYNHFPLHKRQKCSLFSIIIFRTADVPATTTFAITKAYFNTILPLLRK